ncbi:MAG: carbohydrate ABC transporter permease [Clostridia bacterium]|nr:carbohydrate ABC transporter permease [Clostridia bacterium]
MTLNKKTVSRKKLINHTVATAYSVFRFALLIAIGYIVIYPIIYMISSSIKTPAAFSDPSIIYIPKKITFEYFGFAVEVLDYDSALVSTLKYEVVSAVIEILICSFIAYGLARFDFKGKKFFNFILILTILVPAQMIIVPMMTNYSQLDILGIFGLFNKVTGIDIRPNILDTPWTFYLPSIFGVGLRSGILIYIYVQFFRGLPKELEEAAWIDGAGLFRTFFSIAVPSSSVVYTTVTLFALIWHWNDYYLAIMYLSDDFPLAVKIYDIDNLLTIANVWGGPRAISAKAAACLMFILPMLILYLFLQRKFVQSIDRVGITG